MPNPPFIDHTQIVPDGRDRAQDTVGDEGGASLVGSPKRTDDDQSSEPPPTTPDDADTTSAPAVENQARKRER